MFSDVKRVAANGQRLRIELSKPAGDLATRLAFSYGCPVPLGFPVDPAGVSLTVGSGPYYVARHEPGKLLVVKRNPYYRGSRPHRFDRVVATFGGDLEAVGERWRQGRSCRPNLKLRRAVSSVSLTTSPDALDRDGLTE